MTYLLYGLAAIALAAPAQASDQPKADAVPIDEPGDVSQNRIICKHEKVTGSRLGSRKVCKTAAQWKQIRQDERQALERGQSNRPVEGG